jgi:hypothetical protein
MINSNYKYKCKTCQAPLKAKFRSKGVRQIFCNRVCKANFKWTHTCVICNTQFYNAGPTGKYCSSQCKERSRTSIRGKIETCRFCNSGFKVRASNNCGRFCSRKCAGFYSQLFIAKLNYRVRAFVYYGLKCNRCDNSNKKTLVVHHKDHDHSNNDISNLEVLCSNCHLEHHWGESLKTQKQISQVKQMEDYHAVKVWKEKHRLQHQRVSKSLHEKR